MHKRYLLWLLLLGCITLLPAIALNWILLRNEGDIRTISFAASDWQEQTHGITFTPTMGNNHFFKTLRLYDRLPGIDTVIFGASTGFTIGSETMPSGWKLYNFTSGSSLHTSIPEAEYLMQHAPQIKHYIIMIDWALGFVYDPGNPPAIDFSRPDRTQEPAQKQSPATIAMLQEAASYPRMVKLGQIFRSIMHAPNQGDAFRQYFLQLGSDEYTCADGKSRGKDFGVFNRGTCNGFRYDGSATYFDYARVDNAAPMIISAVSSSSQYARSLSRTHGVPNQILLDRLAALNDQLAARGGQLILVMPPLIPGMEQAFIRHPQLSHYLSKTKQIVGDWSKSHRITLFDFGASEQYGCRADDFIDPHHAAPSCYQKIFKIVWPNQSAPANTH